MAWQTQPGPPGPLHWSARYVLMARYVVGGRTFPDLDCWGLVADVHRTELGIELPTYALTAESDQAEVRAAIAGATCSPYWEPADPAKQPREFAVAWYRIMGHEHVAIFVDPRHVLFLTRTGASIRHYGTPALGNHMQGIYYARSPIGHGSPR